MFKLDLEKAEEPEIKLPTSTGSSKKQEKFKKQKKKQESSRKTSISALLTMPKPLTVWITTNCGKFLRKWEYHTTLTCLLRNLYAGQEVTELDLEKQTGFKLGKEAVYCRLAYLTYTQSTSCEVLGWMKHRLESRLPGEISITSDLQMTPPLWQKAKKN